MSDLKFVGILTQIVSGNKRDNGASSHAGRLRWLMAGIGFLLLVIAISVSITKWYESSDADPSRGAIAVANGAFDETYAQPMYLNQGWQPSDSLWFYNTTQGSGMVPYDFFLVLEERDTESLLRSVENMDAFRYLPQGKSKFNEDALPVGFVKDSYKGKDYLGLTCAACHTSQVNFAGQALRIDGGPAMSNMPEFLKALEQSMKTALLDGAKRKRFIRQVIALNNDYDQESEVIADLQRWSASISLYNTVNHTSKKSEYGYARLDAFGRIYNRVLQHVINKEQVRSMLSEVVSAKGNRIINNTELDNVLNGLNATILGDKEFSVLLQRLQSKETGYPGLSKTNMLRVRNKFFNEPNAPVSYPFLWDIAQSDYVQWNGIANNAGPGPLGRNAGEVIGVFGILDWGVKEPGFSLQNSLAAWLTNQNRKARQIDFTSSINLTNLNRLESRLKSLQSPLWSDAKQALKTTGVDTSGWEINPQKADRGRLLYGQYCQSCHELIDRSNWDRIVIAKMSNIKQVGTDPTMALNSVNYKGASGNFEHTTQSTDVGTVIIEAIAPVAQILTSATTGVVATPDPDKWKIRAFAEWVYTLVTSIADNTMLSSIKSGNYLADTTVSPYNSLLSYKARSLNGIWATAPYLHNGSVPSLYDLLLPAKKQGDPENGEYRPVEFVVGSREFDPVKVGFRQQGYAGFVYKTTYLGNHNTGHEYAAGNTAQANGKTLPALNKEQRFALLEFLKTL